MEVEAKAKEIARKPVYAGRSSGGGGTDCLKSGKKNGRKENKSVNSINLRARKTRRECINSRLETEVTFYLNPNHHVLR